MNIAIVRLSALGDIVHSLFVLEFIKRDIKNINIDFICEEAFAPLLENNPYIRNIITVNLKQIKKTKSIKKIVSLIAKLNSLKSYDLVIDMQGLIKSAIISRIVSKNVAGFGYGYAREYVASFFYKHKYNIRYDMNSIVRNANIVSSSLNIRIKESDILNKNSSLNVNHSIKNKLNKNEKNVLFIIGSSWDSKNYPKEKFTSLANMFAKDTDTKVHICYGNDLEKEKAVFICKNSKAKLLKKMSIKELISFINGIDLVIGNDSGPTHMAWALNKASIVLFGCTPKERMYETSINVAIKSSSKIDHFKLNKNDYSIKEIQENDIYTLAQGLLKDG